MAVVLTLEHIHALIDPAPVPTWIVQHGLLVYVNSAALDLLGARTADEVLHTQELRYVHPDFHQMTRRRTEEMTRGEVAATVEQVYQTLHGIPVHVEVTGWPIPLAGGEAYRVSFVDITARREAERRLRNSLDRFRRMITQAPFPMILHAEDRTILQISSTVTELTGYGLDDLPTIDVWVQKAYQERGPEVLERITQLYSIDRRVDMGEYQVHTADGGIRFWTFVASPVGKDEVGRRLVLSVAADVTGRTRTELALQSSERRFRGTFEQAAVGIAHVSTSGRWLRVNKRLTGIVGWGEDEMMGRTFADITHPDDLEADLQQLGELLNGRIDTYSMEKRYFRRDHSCIWVNLTVSLVRKEDGEPDYFISVVEDINRRKLAEEQVQRLNEALEQRVVERTRQLSEANQELEAFAYSVSHDLRGPLRAVAGFSEILLSEKAGQLDDEAQGYLSHVTTSALRMGELIEDILALSRVNRAKIEITNVDLTSVSGEVLTLLRQRDESRHVRWEIAPGLVARGDERLLRIVMENLLGNAWKYTSKRANALIEVGVRQDKGRRPIYFVRDNGAGFNMKHAAKLFRPFQRLHRESEFEGTGIGLATVARILHRQKGEIWAEAAPEQGATFYFTLAPEENDA